MRPSYGNCITELVTEMPRSFSSAIQSEVAWRAALRPLTEPAIWIAPPNSSSFSVSVVLPASGCEMIANVRRRAASLETSDMAAARRARQEAGKAADYSDAPCRRTCICRRAARSGGFCRRQGVQQGTTVALQLAGADSDDGRQRVE